MYCWQEIQLPSAFPMGRNTAKLANGRILVGPCTCRRRRQPPKHPLWRLRKCSKPSEQSKTEGTDGSCPIQFLQVVIPFLPFRPPTDFYRQKQYWGSTRWLKVAMEMKQLLSSWKLTDAMVLCHVLVCFLIPRSYRIWLRRCEIWSFKTKTTILCFLILHSDNLSISFTLHIIIYLTTIIPTPWLLLHSAWSFPDLHGGTTTHKGNQPSWFPYPLLPGYSTYSVVITAKYLNHTSPFLHFSTYAFELYSRQ